MWGWFKRKEKPKLAQHEDPVAQLVMIQCELFNLNTTMTRIANSLEKLSGCVNINQFPNRIEVTNYVRN